MFGIVQKIVKDWFASMAKDKSPTSKKGRAFYVGLFSLVLLFVYGDLRGADSTQVINCVTNLALLYIGGVAVIDSVKQYKSGDINSPEKKKEMQERYKDR